MKWVASYFELYELKVKKLGFLTFWRKIEKIVTVQFRETVSGFQWDEEKSKKILECKNLLWVLTIPPLTKKVLVACRELNVHFVYKYNFKKFTLIQEKL